MRNRTLFLLFGFAFVIFLHYTCGALAPYRDAGEFAAAAKCLTVAHPPGYPFYILFSKIFASIVSVGNVAYRLNVLSALALAGSFVLGVFFMVRYYGVRMEAAVLSMALFVSSRVATNLGFVSEMYTMGLAMLILLLICFHEAVREDAVNGKYLFLSALLLPLVLGVRMDAVLAVVYTLPFLPRIYRSLTRQKRFFRVAGLIALFYGIGMSVFLYLPIRSHAKSVMNWGDPSTLSKLLAILMRKSHGSTLDLLSTSYEKGAMFFNDAVFWVKVAGESFWWIGLALALLGIIVYTFRSYSSSFPPHLRGRIKVGGNKVNDHYADSPSLLPSLLMFFFTGPLFLYLANLPPNPHALKVLEDHFLPSLFIVALWVALGINVILRMILDHPRPTSPIKGEEKDREASVSYSSPLVGEGRWGGLSKNNIIFTIFTLISLCLLIYGAQANSLRHNFYAHDYVKNMYKSAPKNSIVVLHEDVQLFSAWNQILNHNARPDIRIVADGLSGSYWYQDALREHWGYKDIALGPKLNSEENWKKFIMMNRGKNVLAGFDTRSAGNIARNSNGLLAYMCIDNRPQCQAAYPSIYSDYRYVDPWPFFVYRGSYRYEDEDFFFDKDLTDDYSTAADNLALRNLKLGDCDRATKAWKLALKFKRTRPSSFSGIAYCRSKENDWKGAEGFWESSRDKSYKLLELAGKYSSLDDVSSAFKTELSRTLSSIAVAKEKLGEGHQAQISLYEESIKADPANIQAHFNLAAVYWRIKDGPNAKKSFENVLKLNPAHPEARRFLSLLR
ncbi:protein O-mannosyl-transferase family [Elusimicrobiota bacterium]